MPKHEDLVCVKCGLTEHTLLATYDKHWDDEDHGVSGGSTHEFFSCNGCKKGTYRISSWFSEAPGETDIEFWPPRPPSNPPREPLTFKNLPEEGAVESVYKQTIKAFNSASSTLAAAGVRLLIEGTCRDRGIVKGRTYTEQNKLVRNKAGKVAYRDNLEGKINALRDKGWVSKNQAKVLHQLRKLGNDAAHELDEPPMGLVGECIDAVEHMFKQVYDHLDLLKKLQNRKKKPKSA